jgi:hypothetical protein
MALLAACIIGASLGMGRNPRIVHAHLYRFAPIEALTVDRVFAAVLDLHDTWISDRAPLKP